MTLTGGKDEMTWIQTYSGIAFDLLEPTEEMVNKHVVREVDLRLMLTEARDLLGPQVKPWGVDLEPFKVKIEPWSSDKAETVFLYALNGYLGQGSRLGAVLCARGE